MQKIKDHLIQLGLKDKEADVYLAVLSLGKGTITDIARKSGIKRTSIYQYLEPLLKEALLYKITIQKRVFYAAENPKKIIKLLEHKKSEIDEKKRNIQNILPNLEALYSASLTKPSITFYEGKEGIRNVYHEIVNTHKKVYCFFSPKNFFQLFSYEENDKLLMTLYKNGGVLYNLIEKSDEADKRLQIKKYNSFVKTKILPDKFTFNTDLLIVGDTIALISFDNLIAVTIQDAAIARLQKNIFEMIWKSIK